MNTKQSADYTVSLRKERDKLRRQNRALRAALDFIARAADEQNTAKHDGYDLIRDKAIAALGGKK